MFYKSEVTRTPTSDFGDRHTNQLILHSPFFKLNLTLYLYFYIFNNFSALLENEIKNITISDIKKSISNFLSEKKCFNCYR